MKKYLIITLMIISTSALFGENAEIFLKQVELEKVFSSKVTSFLNKMFDEKDYYVFTDVQLEYKPVAPIENTKKKIKPVSSNEGSNPFGYTFIEGLGLDGDLPTMEGIDKSTKKSSSSQRSDDDYKMSGLKISVYLNENIYTVESRETITNFVNTNIPEIRNCFDCFTLEKMPTKKDISKNITQENDRMMKLENEIKSVLTSYEELRDSIKWSIFQQEQQALRKEIQNMQEIDAQERALLEKQLDAAMEASNREKDLLERQLDEASSAREFWEDQEARRKELDRNIDSLKYVSLLEIEKEYRDKQNTLLDNISIDYEKSIQSRLDDAKTTEGRLFDLLEKKESGDEDEAPAGGLTSGNNILLIIVGIVALILLVLVFVLARKKKKVVYLKPKKSAEAAAPQNQGYTPPPTESNYNEDVLRSQIKSLRQSAVSMSAGQKEGASQIISDWLEEGDGGEGGEEGAEE
mgnify:CR=1 FL=1